MKCERCEEERELTHTVESEMMMPLKVCAACAAAAEGLDKGDGRLIVRPLPFTIPIDRIRTAERGEFNYGFFAVLCYLLAGIGGLLWFWRWLADRLTSALN
jgi:hypothetical protein